MATAPLRPLLGDFASIVCTKSIVVGMEGALGERAAHVALLAAGRARGRQIANAHVPDRGLSLDDLTVVINRAIGSDGTRLCILERLTDDNGIIRAYLSETLCSAGEPEGSTRVLTFTLGAVQGVVETVTGRALKGRQVESVLPGGKYDVIEFADRI